MLSKNQTKSIFSQIKKEKIMDVDECLTYYAETARRILYGVEI